MSSRFRLWQNDNASGSPISPKASSQVTRTSNASVGLCENCGQNPKFIENGRVHPYCGRRCATEYKRISQQTSNYNLKPRALIHQRPSQNDWVKIPADCPLQGCTNTGRPQFGGFCSDSHARDAIRKNCVKACSQCGALPRSSGDVCISCQRSQGKTSLRELNNRDLNFKSVVSTFIDSWNTSDPSMAHKRAPRIVKILEVNLSRKERNSYDAYRKFLDERTLGPISEFATFHSSQCVCDLGTKPNQQPCIFPSCGICSIVRSNFAEFAFGEVYNLGRFGTGIYSYTNARLADKHATSCTSSPYRAILLCSVLLQAGKGSSVVDEETVFVQDSTAIVPTHVILYT